MEIPLEPDTVSIFIRVAPVDGCVHGVPPVTELKYTKTDEKSIARRFALT
jgi:hypothetical protein